MDTDSLEPVPEDLRQLVEPLDFFRSREQEDNIGGERLSLLNAIVTTRHSLATDPRDKLYALLGLTNDGPSIIPLPNYTQDVQTVFLQATTGIVVKQKKVMAILLATRSKGPDSPSWAPDWGNIGHVSMPQWITRCIEYARCSKDVPLTVDARLGLRIPCMLYTRIEVIFASPPTWSAEVGLGHSLRYPSPGFDDRTCIRELMNGLVWNSYAMNEPLSDKSNIRRRLITHLRFCLGKHVSKDWQANETVSQWMQWNNHMCNVVAGPEAVRDMMRKELDRLTSGYRRILLRKLLPNDELEECLLGLAAGIKWFRDFDMRLALTPSGFCIVHGASQVGDRISYLPNCPLPVVLRPELVNPDAARPTGDGYWLIGECCSEAFAGRWKGWWGERREDQPGPDPWELERVHVRRMPQDYITIY